MIEIEGLPKTTRITICNYDRYQGNRNTDETPMIVKRNNRETLVKPNKNEKNEKEENNRDTKFLKPNKNDDEFYVEL
ncbi:hypothetical protein [Carboxylicivirga caseinilyticus]|uniref:hypothetical protein n=1 Tax=Carboxylicivirga caseinilyticus TaxID=3417572 RepID=UPI003D326381|nr:hypothetical protein [Marinilabiliaceae bacterium A049]